MLYQSNIAASNQPRNSTGVISASYVVKNPKLAQDMSLISEDLMKILEAAKNPSKVQWVPKMIEQTQEPGEKLIPQGDLRERAQPKLTCATQLNGD